MRFPLLLFTIIKNSWAIVDMGLKPHVKTEVTLLELHDPKLPKSVGHSMNGFGFQGDFVIRVKKKIKLINFVEFYTIGFGDKFQIGIDQVYGGVMIGSSILRNSDKMFLDSYARCNLRMFSCKKTRARANTYFQKFEVCTEFILCVL